MMTKHADLDIEIIRTNRKKTVSLRLRDGQLQMVVPNRMSQRRINDILTEKSGWIRKTLQKEALAPVFEPKTYLPGETFMFLGEGYQLALGSEENSWPCLSKNELIASGGTTSAISTQIHAWYLQSATQHLLQQTTKYAELMNAKPASVKVKAYKSRWGACSARGDLTYNWRIILAPADIVDYVVVHELAHLHHHNHSARFWACVAETLPDYKERNRWLKENGSLLRLD